MNKKSEIYELKIWGDYACFTRPEFNYERVSYDVITPSSARAIFECICWDHAIEWTIHQIAVLKPIKLVSYLCNEFNPSDIAINEKNILDKSYVGTIVKPGEGRDQRNSLVLKDVAYLIKASFTTKKKPIEEPDCKNELDIIAKFQSIFERRANSGKYFYAPYLGIRQFPASFELKAKYKFDLAKEELLDIWQEKPYQENRYLGIMFYDFDYEKSQELEKGCPRFMKNLMMKDGVIDIDKYKPIPEVE